LLYGGIRKSFNRVGKSKASRLCIMKTTISFVLVAFLKLLRNRLIEFQPHISASDLHKIKCPVLILSCDRDLIPEGHTLFIYRNIPRANLCIFPGENHYVTKNNPILFNSAVAKYFSEPFKGEELRHGD
jgi:pimeloyl-ACP methyl ester carboxylesterase